MRSSNIFQNFYKILKPALELKMSSYTLMTVTNMLALDYELRSIATDAKSYCQDCILKIEHYLKSNILEEQNFAQVLGLFAAAISNVTFKEKSSQAELLDEKTIEQLLEKNGKLKILSIEEKNIIKELLLDLKSLDSSVNLALLGDSGEIISRNIAAIMSQDRLRKQQVIQELLFFIQLQNKYKIGRPQIFQALRQV